VAVYSNGCIDPSDPKDPKTGKSIYPSCMTINGQAYPTVPNTDNAEDYNSGFKWQCVEFVNRYYYQIYGTSVSGGNANVYYQNAAAKGLIAYPNRGSVPPQIGDIIVSEGNINNVGHVAIVWDVSPNNIHLVEQNWNEGPGDLDHVLAITSGNNVADFNTAYPVTGWLRLPSVSGKVTLNGTGLPGVGVMLTGNSSKQTSTDANGNYSFAGVVNGSYTLIAFESGYAFTPSSQSITVNNVDLAKLTVNKGILTVQDIIAAVSSTIPTSYTIIDLGSLGGERTSANGINNSGQVVGGSEIDYTTGNTHAFLYSDGTMKDLGTLPGYPWSYATAINDLGQIVGTIDPRDYNMSFHAFLYSDGTITDLGTLPGTTRSNAWDINNSGDVVGYSYNPTRAFIYNGGTMKAFGSDGCMTAQGINNSGQVVGIITDPPNYTFSHAFLSDGETIRDLGTLGGRNSNAAGINDSGQVVGQSENLSGLARAFLYSDGTMIDLGTLPGDNQSIAIAINNSGQIVGFSFNPDGSSRAFLYSGGTMIDLQTLLGPDSDWTYLSPSGINDKGQIIGVGQRKNLFGQKAFLMTPN
jgi:probable HAF family extracellular repeat protein